MSSLTIDVAQFWLFEVFCFFQGPSCAWFISIFGIQKSNIFFEEISTNHTEQGPCSQILHMNY